MIKKWKINKKIQDNGRRREKMNRGYHEIKEHGKKRVSV